MSRLFSYRVRSRSHFLVLAATCFLFVGNVQGQEEKGDIEECCTVMSIDGENLIVYARHMETGRVLQFGVDEADIRSVRIGDIVGATFSGETAVVTSIAGADRNYATIIRPSNDLEWPPSDIFRPRKIEECCTIIANPELSGITGRVVVNAIEGVSSFKIEVFKAGTTERVRNWYGNSAVDLLPGDYDVKLNGVLVTGATVNRQSDTTIRCGALSVNLSDDSKWEVFDEAQETRFNNTYGTATIALPIGVYAVRVAGGWLRIEIEDGAVTTI